MAKVRIPLQVEEGTKQWLKEKAEELGITVNGVINIAISQYRDQSNMFSSLDSIKDMLKVMEKLQENKEK